MMLILILKWWARLALPFFTKKISFKGKEHLAEKGPLILAVNHPNSFFDAIIMGAFMDNPTHYLARGDVFRIGWVRKLLTQMNMLPIYRMRDGKDKLNLNDQTFELSRQVLAKKGILLVFVEGFCEHQTTLQLPLKKGAPRVIDECWRQGTPVAILPVWLTYSSFTQFPKNIEINLGEVLKKPAGIENEEPALVWQKINDRTTQALQQLEKQPKEKARPLSGLASALLGLPAILGAVLHAPLYLPIKAIVGSATKDTVHYDSALFAVLMFIYPLFLLALGFVMVSLISWPWFFFPLVVFPLLARAFVVWK
jgi:1-acyl-sn-glycerol-3-phosphate acyltransferase